MGLFDDVKSKLSLGFFSVEFKGFLAIPALIGGCLVYFDFVAKEHATIVAVLAGIGTLIWMVLSMNRPEKKGNKSEKSQVARVVTFGKRNVKEYKQKSIVLDKGSGSDGLVAEEITGPGAQTTGVKSNCTSFVGRGVHVDDAIKAFKAMQEPDKIGVEIRGDPIEGSFEGKFKPTDTVEDVRKKLIRKKKLKGEIKLTRHGEKLCDGSTLAQEKSKGLEWRAEFVKERKRTDGVFGVYSEGKYAVDKTDHNVLVYGDPKSRGSGLVVGTYNAKGAEMTGKVEGGSEIVLTGDQATLDKAFEYLQNTIEVEIRGPPIDGCFRGKFKPTDTIEDVRKNLMRKKKLTRKIKLTRDGVEIPDEHTLAEEKRKGLVWRVEYD